MEICLASIGEIFSRSVFSFWFPVRFLQCFCLGFFVPMDIWVGILMRKKKQKLVPKPSSTLRFDCCLPHLLHLPYLFLPRNFTSVQILCIRLLFRIQCHFSRHFSIWRWIYSFTPPRNHPAGKIPTRSLTGYTSPSRIRNQTNPDFP